MHFHWGRNCLPKLRLVPRVKYNVLHSAVTTIDNSANLQCLETRYINLQSAANPELFCQLKIYSGPTLVLVPLILYLPAPPPKKKKKDYPQNGKNSTTKNRVTASILRSEADR